MSMINMILTMAMLCPPYGETILTKIEDNTIFTNGKPSGKDGIKATVVTFPDFSKITVKIPGATEPITQDEIDEANASGKFVWVKFEGFKAKTYTNFKTRETGISASATSIELCVKPQSVTTI